MCLVDALRVLFLALNASPRTFLNDRVSIFTLISPLLRIFASMKTSANGRSITAPTISKNAERDDGTQMLARCLRASLVTVGAAAAAAPSSHGGAEAQTHRLKRNTVFWVSLPWAHPRPAVRGSDSCFPAAPAELQNRCIWKHCRPEQSGASPWAAAAQLTNWVTPRPASKRHMGLVYDILLSTQAVPWAQMSQALININIMQQKTT